MTSHEHNINTNPFTRCFNGLDKLFKYNQSLALIILVISILGFGLQMFNYSYTPDSSSDTTISEPTTGEPINVGLVLAVVIPTAIVILTMVTVFSVYFMGLANYVAWKTSRSEPTSFSEAMRAVTSKFWTILAVYVVVYLKTLGGLLLFIIPGIRAFLRYQMVLFPVFDENLRAGEAIKRIKSLTKHHLLEVFGINSVASIVPFIGILLSMGGEAVMYPELKASATSKHPYPKIHWLNYLGFFILALVILFIIGIIAIIVAYTGSN